MIDKGGRKTQIREQTSGNMPQMDKTKRDVWTFKLRCAQHGFE